MAKCQELWAINREDKKEQAKEPVILNKYAGLYEENSDLTGWLSIDGMKINYPVRLKFFPKFLLLRPVAYRQIILPDY